MKKIHQISLELNFTPNSLGGCGLSRRLYHFEKYNIDVPA